jgi:molecular chaperone GrpE (heat shock protein)
MARGKHATIAAHRREAELSAQLDEVTRTLRDERMRHRDEMNAAKEMLAAERRELVGRVAEQVEQMLVGRVERLHSGLAGAVWKAQRIATTQHLAWLFLHGYLDWNRLEGDREVLTFICTHGDMTTWWLLMDKHGHRSSRKTHRENAKASTEGINATKKLLSVLRNIDRALSGDDRMRAEREALDEVVDMARDAFLDVELGQFIDAINDTVTPPSEDDILLHGLVMRSLDEMTQAQSRVTV